MLAPRAASHGAPDSAQQALAGGHGVAPAVRAHHAVALAVAAEVEDQRGQPGRRRLLAHQLVVLLAAAGAVADEQRACRRARRPEEPAGQLDAVRRDRERQRRRRGGRGTAPSGASLANGVRCDVLPSHPVDGGPMHEVNVGRKTLADYRSIVPKDLMTEIDELGEPLKGRQVLHVNATAFGGGVAEILYTLVPLVTDIGLEAHWQILTAPPEFFNVTKSFHNGLQGHAVDFPHGVARPLRGRLPRERGRAHASLRLRRHPRPAAAGHPRLRRRAARTARRGGSGAATSTPPRPTSGLYDYLLPSINRLRRRRLHPGGLRAPGSHRPGARDRPHHRPAGAQEHEALRGGRHLHRAPVRHRRGPSAPAAGLALRPLEGPARRGRRLPRRQGQVPGRAARARRLHGQRRSRRAGTTSSASSPTWAATPTSSSSPTSTTSGRWRSTPSRATPT